MSETEKLAAIAALLTLWQSGELSSYDFAQQVEKVVAG
jgi:hypothetical protein